MLACNRCGSCRALLMVNDQDLVVCVSDRGCRWRQEMSPWLWEATESIAEEEDLRVVTGW